MNAAAASGLAPWSLQHNLLLESLATYGSVQLRVTGCSMLPAILPLDILLIEKRPIGQVRPGDVAFIKQDNRLVAHRIIECSPDAILTKGDANPGPDPVGSLEEFLGCVVSIQRNGKIIEKLPERKKLSWLLANSDVLFRIFMYGVAIRARTITALRICFYQPRYSRQP